MKPQRVLDLRVLRGGAFDDDARLVRCAYRYWYDPNYRDGLIGFRVVASPIIHDSDADTLDSGTLKIWTLAP